MWCLHLLPRYRVLYYLPKNNCSQTNPPLKFLKGNPLSCCIYSVSSFKSLSYFPSLFLKIGLAAAEHVGGLKVIEAGLSREKLALIAVPMVPLQIVLPLVIRYSKILAS